MKQEAEMAAAAATAKAEELARQEEDAKRIQVRLISHKVPMESQIDIH